LVVKLDIEKLDCMGGTGEKFDHDYILILKPPKNGRIDQLIVRNISKIVASLVSFLFAVLLTVPQPFVKVGGTCPLALWSMELAP